MVQSDEISKLNGIILWSSKGVRTSRKEELIGKSPIALNIGSIEYNLNGKPFLNTGFVFSISHSLGFSALVVSNVYSSIGIDIEVNRPFKSWERIARRYFLKSEQEYCAENNRLERFWQTWVKKEAIIKCLGGSILENALEVDTINYYGLINNGKMKILYSVLTNRGSDIHVSIACCQ